MGRSPRAATDDDEVERETVAGSGASVGAARVSGCEAGVTVADGATAARVRTGAGSVAGTIAVAPTSDTAAAEGSTLRETTAAVSSSSVAVARVSAAGPSACRWTGRPGSGAWDVRLGTARGCATTRPAGAAALDSCPSGVRIGGSGACPGTSARNGAAGATTGGGPDERWIGGSVRQAPVGGIGAAAPGTEPPVVSPAGSTPDGVPEPASPERLDAPSSDVLRPNGHGRRTGLTPPRTGAG